MRWPRPSGLTVLSAALLLLLPALAVLQYRWVGQVSTAERERMQRNLRNAAIQFRDAFDGEIGRALGALQVGVITARDGRSEQYADRYDVWLDSADYPGVVTAIWVIDAPDAALRLRKYDAGSHTFVERPWAGRLAERRPAFEQQLADFTVDPNRRRRPIASDESMLVAPLRNFRNLQSTSGQIGPVFGFTAIELDPAYIATQVLPALARRFFIHEEGDSYRVAVLNAENATVIYQSDPSAPVGPETADTTQPFFGWRGRGFVGPGPLTGLLPAGPGRGRPTDETGTDGPRTDRPRSTVLPGRAGQPLVPGRWLLAVQHVSGSLEAAVASARRRNLAISFGVLLLLSVSVAVLAQASRRAQRLARQQMEFVAGVSHELRTPIAVIRSAAENLSQGVVGNGARVKQYGQVMEGEARRLGEMVESVLQYAGVESGKGLGALLPVSIGDVVDQAVQSARHSVDAPLNVESRIPSDIPDVLGDNAALTSAVLNLVVNAGKYGGASGWVGVRGARVRRGRRVEVHLTVEDHGPGIPADELPHIFEPFYRGANALGSQIHGNGLGLSLVRRIVRAHGGRVSVRTTEGQGTSFTISLPAAPASGRRSAVPGRTEAEAH